MDRRAFLKTACSSVAAVSALNFATSAAPLLAASPLDMAAVRGGEPDVMFDKAMSAFGGMGQFVRKGDKVLIKPNIGWDVEPERGGDTNPKLVGRIVAHCLQAGAKEVTVFDHTCDPWRHCYQRSGIERAVKDAGGKIVSGDSEGYYQKIAVPGGKRLRETAAHELFLEADRIINVPVLKHHGSSQLSIGMKNLMGAVWDRGYWHRNDLHQCIADFMSFKAPTLTVVDAYLVMRQNGPRGVSKDDVALMKSLIVARDFVAADAAAAKLFGVDPATIPHIQMAAEMGLGKIDLTGLNIDRIKV
ncbi:MAG: DUF362 domain-containing protein [Desulfobulbaceae bacterium]|jgi:uncharacterized protein (DUF362 family)|nr:DUF362 domain-containing protein [Desulfobulbaceae bacterium]